MMDLSEHSTVSHLNAGRDGSLADLSLMEGFLKSHGEAVGGFGEAGGYIAEFGGVDGAGFDGEG